MRFLRLFLSELLSSGPVSIKEYEDPNDIALGPRLTPFADKEEETLQRALGGFPSPYEHHCAHLAAFGDDD